MKNFYQILGISSDATNEEIKTAYRKLAKKFHPDKNEGDKYFEERFKEIQLAYDTLSDNYLRNQYDKKLSDFFQRASSTYQNPTNEYKDASHTETYTTDTAKQNRSHSQKEREKSQKNKKKLSNILKKFFSSKSNIFWIIILSLPIVAYFVNSWVGVISIVGIYFCILMFLGTIDDKEKTFGGCLMGFIGAPVLAIYIIVQIFNFFFSDKFSLENIDNISSVDSTAIPVDSIVTTNADYSKYGIDSTETNIEEQRPITYASLENGESPLTSCFGSPKFAGSAYITFKNSNETDAIVCLVNYSTDKTIRNEYIKAGSDYTMKRIPSGTYFLKVYYGNDWNAEKSNFCGSKGGFNFDESFSKSDGINDLIEIENSRTSYTTGTITLYKVANGNMSSEKINESEFFK